MSLSRFNRHIGNKKGQAFRWRAWRDKTLGPLPDVMTRQRKRAARRAAALAFIYQKWGGESRRMIRAMAFRLATRSNPNETFVPAPYPGRL